MIRGLLKCGTALTVPAMLLDRRAAPQGRTAAAAYAAKPSGAEAPRPAFEGANK